MEIEISKITYNYPYDLLLLADETIEAIHKYLFESNVYIANLPNGDKPIAVFCLFHIDANTVELKNIAVAEQYQGTGIGSRFLSEMLYIAKTQGYREIIVGTADVGLKQIRFYEKNGFVKYGIKENFFLDYYDKPIYENGAQLKNMVMLRKTISTNSKPRI